MKTLNIDSKTADVIRNLRTEAGQSGDAKQVELCNSALEGNHDAYCECVRVVIQDGGNGPDNWDLLDENNNPVDGITAIERDQKLLESLTAGAAEGWVTLADGRRVYAQ